MSFNDTEAFGRIAAEAQALGRMVVATDHGGSRETILHGKTGWLITPNDADSLAKALAKLLDLTQEKRLEISTNCIEHIRTNYSKDLMCARILEVYNELIMEGAV